MQFIRLVSIPNGRVAFAMHGYTFNSALSNRSCDNRKVLLTRYYGGG